MAECRRSGTTPGSSALVRRVPSPEGGGLTIPEQFARSMSLDDALDPRNLLCYEMNGEPLPHKNGFPVRLIAPGWYGVANVKWLTRIEVRDQRHAGNYMARDYVTIREEHRGSSDPFWTFSTVTALPAQVGSSQSRTSRQPLRRPWCCLGCADRGSGSPRRQRTVEAGEALRAGGPQAEQTRPGVEILDVRLGNARRGPAQRDVTGIRRRRQRAAGAGRSVPCQQSDLLGEQRTHHTPGSHSLIATTVAIGPNRGHRIGAAAARYRPCDRTLVACGQPGATPSRFKTRDATPNAVGFTRRNTPHEAGRHRTPPGHRTGAECQTTSPARTSLTSARTNLRRRSFKASSATWMPSSTVRGLPTNHRRPSWVYP